MQYPIYNLLCWKPKINEWKVKALACQFVVMRKLPQWHKSHTNKCFIKELRGKMAQVITEEQKTLMIWLAIDCVCVIASGCLVPIHRNQGQESWTIAWECVCISGCCTYMFTTNIKKNKIKIPGHLHDCYWFTKLYLLHFMWAIRVLIVWSNLQVKRAVRRPNAISNQNNHLH